MADTPAPRASNPTTADAPWPVAQLSEKLRDYIDRLGSVWVEGEITQWGVSGGNVFGKLKDMQRDVTVSFTVWSSVRSRLPDTLKQGDRVVAQIKPQWWLKGGTLTMQVYAMRHVGLGDLLERVERLRRELAAEGLFAPERKKRLPFLPRTVGLITGKDSDAEKDVLRNAALRWPSVSFRVVHAAVQGERTVSEVTSALRVLDADPEVDVIIIARGGGDFQNLLGFSDESLVRAVAEAATPVVSAIGHEADRPILDDVADLRASTPTDAAKRVVPDTSEEQQRIAQARYRLSLRIGDLLRQETERIATLRSRPALAGSEWITAQRSEEVTRLTARGVELTDRLLERLGQGTGELVSRVRTLSPLATLARGYAIAQHEDGGVVRDAARVAADETLTLTLAEGHLSVRPAAVRQAEKAEAPAQRAPKQADAPEQAESEAPAQAPDRDGADGPGTPASR